MPLSAKRGVAPSFIHKPASRAGKRSWAPKELAAELSDVSGVPVSARSIVKRCNKPSGHPAHIATLAAFPGRHWIPDDEAQRLLAAARRGA